MCTCIHLSFDWFFALSVICDWLKKSFSGFNNILSTRATGFHSQAKLFELNFFYKKHFPGDGQNRRAEPTLQLVNVHGVLSLMKPLSLLCF